MGKRSKIRRAIKKNPQAFYGQFGSNATGGIARFALAAVVENGKVIVKASRSSSHRRLVVSQLAKMGIYMSRRSQKRVF